MLINFINSTLDTVEFANSRDRLMKELEEAVRVNPYNTQRKAVIGKVIPLGTLGGAKTPEAQFQSNFQIVAYCCPDSLIKNYKDFTDFNIVGPSVDRGQLVNNLVETLNAKAKTYFGEGWRITIFNATLNTALKSMGKGSESIDSMVTSVGKMLDIVEERLAELKKMCDSNANEGTKLLYEHELVDMFYGGHRAMSVEFKEHNTETSDKSEVNHPITIEALIYDRWANGLRKLVNKESFASTKIRMYDLTSDSDEAVWVFSLKASLSGTDMDDKPIRTFDGNTRLSNSEIKSGCTKRIIYNIVNKNYDHWSYMSIPSTFQIKLNVCN